MFKKELDSYLYWDLVKATLYNLSFYFEKHLTNTEAEKRANEKISKVMPNKIVDYWVKVSPCIVCIFDQTTETFQFKEPHDQLGQWHSHIYMLSLIKR